jgi:hypothetical protein
MFDLAGVPQHALVYCVNHMVPSVLDNSAQRLSVGPLYILSKPELECFKLKLNSVGAMTFLCTGLPPDGQVRYAYLVCTSSLSLSLLRYFLRQTGACVCEVSSYYRFLSESICLQNPWSLTASFHSVPPERWVQRMLSNST